MSLKTNKKPLFLITMILVSVFFISRAKNTPPADELETLLKHQYEQMKGLDGSRPPFDLFEKAMVGYLDLKASGQAINNEKLTVIDFRLSSKKKRMWIIDLQANQVLYHRLVAHGKNTGEEFASRFSNIKNSNQSSLGFYLTAENYTGKHGLSMRLDGLEPGINDLARNRAIVMHSAAYVSKEFIAEHGRLGRSFGCPAIALNKHQEIMNLLANGSLLFIYHPEPNYQNNTLLQDRMKALEYLKAQVISAKS